MRQIIVMVVVLAAAPAAAQWKKVSPGLPPWQGTVVKVEDGDTLVVARTRVRKPARVRLYSADAPELDQPFGPEVRKALSKLVLGKRVKVTPQDAPDRRKKLVVADVAVGRMNLARQLLGSGMAWHLRGPAPDPALAKLQQEAAKARRGLWAAKEPAIPPWKWRRNRRQGVDPACYETCLRRNAMRAESWQGIQAHCNSGCPAKSTRGTAGKTKSPHTVEVLKGGRIEQRTIR